MGSPIAAPSVLSFQAIDNDEPDTPNSELGYRILPGLFSSNFTINETTGQMHSNEPLDREALDDKDGQLVVTVEVYDHGVPPLSTQVNVTITVGVSPGHSGVGRVQRRHPAVAPRPEVPQLMQGGRKGVLSVLLPLALCQTPPPPWAVALRGFISRRTSMTTRPCSSSSPTSSPSSKAPQVGAARAGCGTKGGPESAPAGH